MRAIYDFNHIQVELTNACVHSCSNCTRFCGHHKKPFYMEWGMFKKTIDTLKDWPRIIGIMGGEPTLHPEFERFVEYAHSVHPEPYVLGGGVKPVKSLSRYIDDVDAIKSELVNKRRGLGLWTSVCATYAKHYEIIQDKFVFQCINDHTASSRHQAWLMTRKEFGISDSDWIKMRDNCWWQRMLGSPSVTPKGAFFCEVAAAMDMLFDGSGGWKVEPDWWKRSEKDFGEQLKWCEYCSGAFTDFERDANEEVDDISPVMFEKLIAVQSPKVARGKVVVHKAGEDSDVRIFPRLEILQYQSDFSKRVTEKNDYIRINDIRLINESTADFGLTLARVSREYDGWVVVCGDDATDKLQVLSILQQAIFNPGVLYHFESINSFVFSTRAQSLRSLGFDGLRCLEKPEDLRNNWQMEKFVIIPTDYQYEINPDLHDWEKKITENGLMWHYRIGDGFTSIGYRSTVFIDVDDIVNSDMLPHKKLSELTKIKVLRIHSGALTSKLKTAIHNILAELFKQNDYNVNDVKNALLGTETNRFINYALALITTGDEKIKYLMKIVRDTENVVGFGWSALIDEKIYSKQGEKSIFENIIDSIKKPFVILGNRYPGKSVQMISVHAGLKALAFADDERHGSEFGGTMTYSVPETVKMFGGANMLMAVYGEADIKMRGAVVAVGFTQSIIDLNQIASSEMHGSRHFGKEQLNAVEYLKCQNVSDDVIMNKILMFR